MCVPRHCTSHRIPCADLPRDRAKPPLFKLAGRLCGPADRQSMTLKIFVFRRLYLPGSSIFESSCVSFCVSQMLTKQARPCLVPAASKTRLLLMIPSLQMVSQVRMSYPCRKATNLTTVHAWTAMDWKKITRFLDGTDATM
jgi:hypothetical protein